jgi:hypothetical protein
VIFSHGLSIRSERTVANRKNSIDAEVLSSECVTGALAAKGVLGLSELSSQRWLKGPTGIYSCGANWASNLSKRGSFRSGSK